MTSRDNRRSPRKHHDSVLEIFDESEHLIAAIGRLIDVSTVGLRFSSTKTLHKGDKIHARLRLLKEGTLEIHGRVVWMKKKIATTVYGVEFDRVNTLSR